MFSGHPWGVRGLGCQRFITLFIIFRAKKIQNLTFSELAMLSTRLIALIIDTNALISYDTIIEQNWHNRNALDRKSVCQDAGFGSTLMYLVVCTQPPWEVDVLYSFRILVLSYIFPFSRNSAGCVVSISQRLSIIYLSLKALGNTSCGAPPATFTCSASFVFDPRPLFH